MGCTVTARLAGRSFLPPQPCRRRPGHGPETRVNRFDSELNPHEPELNPHDRETFREDARPGILQARGASLLTKSHRSPREERARSAVMRGNRLSG